jgi:16S rRNA (cytosine1402-N4)-methyltransferase
MSGNDSITGTGEDARHQSVLWKEVLELVVPAREDGIFVDATVGLGGHSARILERWPQMRLIAIDRDPSALAAARGRLAPFGDRVTFLEGRHEELIENLERVNVTRIDAILADLGVSSMQLDDAERGFSFRRDAPLDMRMSSAGPSAAEYLASVDLDELTMVLRKWGEEPFARPIAKAIVAQRESEPIDTTAKLAALVRRVKKIREKIDPATLTFQALRIVVNREIVDLESFIDSAADRLAPAGSIGIISFHSLEDRIVKQTFRRLEGICVCPPELPVCGCGKTSVVKVVTKRPVEAGEEEVSKNPRSRSARLRVARKLE